MSLRPLAIPIGALALTGFAHASLTFGNVSVTGASIVDQGTLGTNGYTIKFDAASSKATGIDAAKEIVVRYTVTSTQALTGYTFGPLGTVYRGGDVKVSLKTGSATSLFEWSSPLTATQTSSLAQKPDQTLAPAFRYDVVATIDLSTSTNRLGIASLSQYNIAYQATPAAVPEPASCAVLALGGLGLVRRRIKGARP